MSTRDLNHTSLIVGMKGSGKSTDIAVLVDKYPGNAIIIDVNGSAAYNKFPQVTLAQACALKKGKVRLLGTPDEDTLIKLAKHFRNGLLVFEDCTKYIYGNVRPEIRTFLVDHRMYNVDLVFTFHNLNRIPPLFWEMTSFLLLKKTVGNLPASEYKNRIPNFEAVQAAYNRIQAHKSPYYSETIETMI